MQSSDVLPSKGRRRTPAARTTGVLVGLAVAVVFCAAVIGVTRVRDQTLRSGAAVAATSISRGVDQVGFTLTAIEGFFAGSESVTPEEFERFTASLLADYPEPVAVALRVTEDELGGFREQMTAWYPGVELYHLRGDERVPMEPTETHHIVAYRSHEPADPLNLGFDVASEAILREAIDQATTGDSVAVSGFVGLLDDEGVDGFVIVRPIQDQSGDLIGVALAASSASSMVSAWVPESVRDQFEITVLGPEGRVAPGSSWLQPTITVVSELPGRTWSIAVNPIATTRRLLVVIGVGIVSVVLLGFGGASLANAMAGRRVLQRRLSWTEALASERERAIVALSDYELLARNSTDIILRHDPDLVCHYVSPAVEAVLGYAPETLIGTHPWGKLHKDDLAVVQASIDDLVAGAEIAEVEHRTMHANGRWVWFHSRSRALRDPTGKLVELQTASRDVTEQVKQRQALQEARAETERTSAEKARFLAAVSHEIRTPLNAVAGISGLLEDTDLDVVQREYAVTIREASESVVTIVTDLLDLSKAEVGLLRIERIPMNVNDTLSEVIRILGPQARSKGLAILSEIGPMPDALLGDPHRIRQVLVNLVANAIKFTQTGAITIGVAISESSDGMRTRFEIRDTGEGISSDRLEAVFDDFEQADGSISGRFGGTGLGLGISRELVLLMGGSMGVESDVGVGSMFWFELPLSRKGVAEPPVERCVVAGRPHDRHRFAAMLRRLGWLVVEADEVDTSCQERQVLVASVDEVESHHDLSGVIVVDTTPRRGNAQKVKECSAAGYLGVPATSEELADLLHQPADQGFLTRYGADRASLKILAVDDAASNRLLVERALSRRGHRVALASDGVDALETFAADTFDVVLLDSEMPRMNGIEVAKAIREREAGSDRRTPIVFLSGRTGDDDISEALVAGADVYLAKPFDLKGLYRAVEELGHDPEVPVPEVQPSQNHGPVVDRGVFLSQFGDQPELAREMTASVHVEWEEVVGHLSADAVRDEVEVAGAAAHRMRGVLALIGATSAAEAAHRLESAARDGDVDSAIVEAGELVAAIHPMEEALAELLDEMAASTQPKR